MMFDLNNFYKLVDEGYLRVSQNEDLILFNYTDQTTFERYWTPETRIARGLIFEKSTGNIIAVPFPKFFNLGEMEETMLHNLPNTGNYEAFEKVDGSLGIIYWYNGNWEVATRGSLGSEQAIKAKSMLKQYNLDSVPRHFTVLAEIVYPENKIVVNYGKEEKLVVLGVYDSSNMQEVPFEYVTGLAAEMGIPIAKSFNYTIKQMMELQKTLPKDEEGFVIRFPNGLRVKIKGEEYLKIHKIISNMTPIAFWEVMKEGKVDEKYLMQVPEEFKKDFEPIVTALEQQYTKIKEEIQKEVASLQSTDKREVGMFIQGEICAFKHKAAIFPVLNNNLNAIDKYILKQIRPTNNKLIE